MLSSHSTTYLFKQTKGLVIILIKSLNSCVLSTIRAFFGFIKSLQRLMVQIGKYLIQIQ